MRVIVWLAPVHDVAPSLIDGGYAAQPRSW